MNCKTPLSINPPVAGLDQVLVIQCLYESNGKNSHKTHSNRLRIYKSVIKARDLNIRVLSEIILLCGISVLIIYFFGLPRSRNNNHEII